MSIDRFFTMMKDGSWHALDEMSQQLGIETTKLAEFSKFLYEHGLLKYDDRSNRIRIDPMWKLLLPEDQSPEPKTTIATFIIPPETSIDVQSTRLSNLGNIEVEVTLRLDSRVKEVAIRV